MRKVVLIGYMGCGKSVIAQKLGEKTGIPVAELDGLIEKECEMPIASIFELKGELFFRRKEHEIFVEMLDTKRDIIISAGGGTLCYYNNHEWLKREGVVSFYLKASIDTLFNRLVTEKQKRPLLANLSDSEAKDFIAKHLFDRSFYYHQALHTINVDGKGVSDIVNEILTLLA